MENQNQPKTSTGYSEERRCERCKKRYIATSRLTKYCKPCRKERTKENVAAYKLRRQLHLVETRKIKEKLLSAEVCWWCLGVCKPGENCPDCGTPYDLEKATKARNRQSASYLDIVAANAKKHGKSPREEIERIRNLRTSGSYGNKQYWQDVDNVLNDYLKKKGYRPKYNGVPVKIKKRAMSRSDREKPA